MKKSMSSIFIYPHQFKFVGILLIILALITFLYRIVTYDIVDLTGASLPVASGLALIFFSKDKDFDERIIYLKFKSLAIGVPGAAIIVMLINYYYNFNGYSVETNSWYSISAFEYLTIALGMALGCYYYFKVKA
ncbi:hypothetical protein [Pareuzebyella sediminis]|uniref:hypothetical protein n=1 Tax=Pareuzebyella sediminis TaxID=2607998 RepID=UPI0011ED440B|nr:hypothetical protein [Pareuzebyella sediminis]